MAKPASTNSLAYDVIRTFRDYTFERIRAYTQRASGAKYIADLKVLVGKERWDERVRSARQLRTARVITQPLLDDFDAQDVSELPKLFEKKYEALVDVKGQKQELLSALSDIARFRDGIAHPAFISVSVEDARRIAGRILTAAGIVFSENTNEFRRISECTNALFDYRPTTTSSLIKSLPPRQEILGQFVGRENELQILYSWLGSACNIWVLEGDGGKGKSSLAFVFAESLDSAGDEIERIIWLSAKSKKFQDGAIRVLQPDFTDLPSAFRSIIAAQGFDHANLKTTDELEAYTLELLQAFPALIVLDDVDSIAKENEAVAYWFTNQLARDARKCKVLVTTRREPFGLGTYTTKVAGLTLHAV